MDYFIYIVICNSFIGSVRSTVNYCGAKICNNTNSHTFCRYHEGPSTTCIGYMEAPLTLEEKLRLLTKINQRRSDVAQGALRNFPPAANMLKVRWVEELSRSAQRWADQCRPPAKPEEKDTCRDLYAISVGQCVASLVGEAPGLRAESFIDMWYMQSLYYDENVTNYVLSNSKGKYYGDFAQMIWANTHMVGCGRSRFMIHVNGRLRTVERLVCNFAPRGPPPGLPIWMPGYFSAKCPRRATRDTFYTKLCTYRSLDDKPTLYNGTCNGNGTTCETEKEKLTIQDKILLDTLDIIERNESKNYQGNLDEVYLTKMSLVTMNIPRKNGNVLYETRTLANYIDNPSKNTTFFEHVKPKLVGRPKSYTIEELNEINQIIGKNHIHENVYSNNDDGFKHYGKINNYKSPNSLSETNNIEDDGFETNHIVANEDINKKSNVLMSSSNTSVDETINSLVKENNNSLISNDYLSDSESIEELEDVLNRMERALASKPIAGKVRRELRQFSGSPINENSQIEPVNSVKTNDFPLDNENRNFVQRKNKSEGRGPIMSMVMKYVPILRQYENSLKNTNACDRGVFIFDTFFVYTFFNLFVFVL